MAPKEGYARLTKKQQAKFRLVMREWATGKLKSSDGRRVVDREQALAIAFSEARNHGRS